MKSQPDELLEFVEEDIRYARSYYDSWLTDGGLRNDPDVFG